MKRCFKYILIFIFALFIWSICNKVQANSISKISMDIFIDSNGNANVTETWVCSATEGTEIYHPYYNLGNSKISNLTVSENGTNYQTLSYWNTSGSLSSKAYKCGINTLFDGVELCWGISKYGSHTYTVKYNISNFVSELTDSQMVYWTLIPHNFSDTIGSVYVKIYSDFKYSDSLDVWGYGDYGAPTYVYDGVIEMQSNGSLKNNEYMTILVKFPLGTFNSRNYINHNFEYYYNMAEEGATKYTNNSYNKNKGSNAGKNMAIFTTSIIIIIMYVTFFKLRYGGNVVIINRKSKRKVKKSNYYRDIPCKDNLFRAYYIAYQYGIIKNETDILGAMILKWIKDGYVKIEKRTVNELIKKEEEILKFSFIDEEKMPLLKERNLYGMLFLASKDRILEKNELKDWCKKNYRKILSWFENVLLEQKNLLIKEGYITAKEKKTLFGTVKEYPPTETDAMIQEAEKIAGFKKFLLDYTLLSQREAIEVKLFEEYLVYAQMLGIAKKVAKQFKDLYPEIIEQSNFNNYDNILFINRCSYAGIRSAHNGKSMAEARARASSYSSGGGGFSSGGGGGGSFGGGGGGGGFR